MSSSRSAKSMQTTSDPGSAALFVGVHAIKRPRSLNAGAPYAVLSSTSGRASASVRTVLNVAARRVRPRVGIGADCSSAWYLFRAVLVDRRTFVFAGLAAVTVRADQPALSERQRSSGERVEGPALSERQRNRVERVEG